MKGIHSLAGLLLLAVIQGSWQVPLSATDDSSSLEAGGPVLEELAEPGNMKRHTEGTFANDYSKYLTDMVAKDIVRWLANKRSGAATTKRHADGTYTSDVSSYLQDQAVQDFVTWLKNGPTRRESPAERMERHVDGSFTSDVNKVLDSMAAKEYLLWVMTSKPSGERKRSQASH